MRSIWKYQLFCFAALAACGTASRAQAQTFVDLPATGATASFNYDGLTIQISNCVYAPAGGVAGSCTALGAELAGVSTTPGATFEVENTTPGSPLFPSLATGNGENADLSYNLTVTAISTKTTVNSITAEIAGSAVVTATGNPTTPTNLNLSSAATVETPTPVDLLQTYVAGPASATDTSFTAFNPTVAAPIYINADVGMASQSTAGNTLTLNNVTYIFSPAPEPASVAVFMTALTGLGVVRRRSKSGRSQARSPK